MILVNEKIFRAYDIRGIYPEEINEKSVYQIGRAFAVYLREREASIPEKIIVGQDARLSSPALSRSFENGIIDEGMGVVDIGLVTIDEVYFASGHFHLPAAMITASHNPKEWNGVKLMKSGVDFFAVKDLETIINNGKNSYSGEKGKFAEENIKSDYLKHVLSFINIETVKPMRVAIDASNGAVGPILQSVLVKLPMEYTAINFKPDGDFPYHEPDPTKEKNLTDLKNEITAGHYNFGCAFDGDGDRIIFIDEIGEPVKPSIIGAMMAKYFLKPNHYGKVVYAATVSQIVSDVVSAYGGEPIREKVGHTNVSKKLKEINGILGIETSGHYYFKNNFYADSGIISFAVMLQILSSQKKSLSTLAKEFSKYISIPEKNFKIENPENLIKEIAQNFEGYEIDWLDGLTITTPDFWLNLRPSNTEPLLRLNIEAKDEIILERVKKDILRLIESYNG